MAERWLNRFTWLLNPTCKSFSVPFLVLIQIGGILAQELSQLFQMNFLMISM
jgi:hypothetical protein